MTIKLVLVTALLLSIIIPFGTFLYSKKTKGGYKAALGFNIFAFFSILIVSNIMMFTGKVSAAEATAAAASATDGWKFMAAALSTGLSCIGGGIAVASSASAALGAISEDSSIMGKSLIFVAMAEGVCLYGLIISLMILS
jgi:V/A-type H+-transporting ATPase subunit K